MTATMMFFMTCEIDGRTWINNPCSIDLSEKEVTDCLESVAGLDPDNAIGAI
jgi:hypothetical protein